MRSGGRPRRLGRLRGRQAVGVGSEQATCWTPAFAGSVHAILGYRNPMTKGNRIITSLTIAATLGLGLTIAPAQAATTKFTSCAEMH